MRRKPSSTRPSSELVPKQGPGALTCYAQLGLDIRSWISGPELP
jgi:hypothetical protein